MHLLGMAWKQHFAATENYNCRKEEEREEGADQTPVSLTDRSSDGASTTVQFGDSAKRYSEWAKAALARFDKLVTVPYGTRG